MGVYLGDYAVGQTVHFKWNTNGQDGASITRSTNGTLYVYKDDDTTTEVTTGITDTEDFDSNTGIHHCKIALTDTFYAIGHEYAVVLKAATIDTKVVNAVLAHFSIHRNIPGVFYGSVTATSSTTAIVDSKLTQSATDFWKGRIVVWLSGALMGQATDITAFTPASDTLTVSTMTGTPVSGDIYGIY